MKLTGPIILNNYENSIKKNEPRSVSQLKKETFTSEMTNVPSTGVSKFESMGIANLEKSKYYQTQVSLLQKGEKSVDTLYDKLYELEDTNKSNLGDIEKNIKIQEIIKGIENLTNGEDFQKNEILANVNLQSLGLDGYISSSEKDKVLNEALLHMRIKSNELEVLKENNEKELTKLKLANENMKAADSKTIDESNLRENMNTVKVDLQNTSLGLNGKLSQTRVLNILNS